jgi:hypothetical protein
MVMTVLDVDRQAITAFESKNLLIARTASGGTVKRRPPMTEVQITKERDMPMTSTNPSRTPECRAILVKNAILANQLMGALSAIDNWEVK